MELYSKFSLHLFYGRYQNTPFKPSNGKLWLTLLQSLCVWDIFKNRVVQNFQVFPDRGSPDCAVLTGFS